jgi:hypothetical protein
MPEGDPITDDGRGRVGPHHVPRYVWLSWWCGTRRAPDLCCADLSSRLSPDKGVSPRRMRGRSIMTGATKVGENELASAGAFSAERAINLG